MHVDMANGVFVFSAPGRMSRVRITKLNVHPLNTVRFRGGNLDHPTQGGEYASYSIIVDGWVLHRIGHPVIELYNRGELVAQVPTDRRRPDVARYYPDVPGSDLCGFSMVLNTLKLDPRFEAPIEEGDYGGSAIPDSRSRRTSTGTRRRASWAARASRAPRRSARSGSRVCTRR
jgi:hypothetical protein